MDLLASAMPADGKWLADSSWKLVTENVSADIPLGDVFEALREAFPEDWAAELASRGPTPAHLLQNYLVWYLTRFDILDLGLALLELGSPAGLVKRLRNGNEFAGAESEAWAGLLCKRSGAELLTPSVPRSARQGEWIARWPSERELVIEVKRPCWSKAANQAAIASSAFLHAAMDAAGSLQPDAHYNIELRPDPALLTVAARRMHGADVDLTRAIGTEVGRAVRRIFINGIRDGVHSIAPWGAVSVVKMPGRPFVQFGGPVHGPDPAHEAARIQRLLEEAGTKLDAAAMPGLVVLDFANMHADRYTLEILASALRFELPWTKNIAAVLVRERTSEIGASVPYSIVTTLCGPKFAEFPAEIDTALRWCAVGHRHFEPLKSLEEPYRCRYW